MNQFKKIFLSLILIITILVIETPLTKTFAAVTGYPNLPSGVISIDMSELYNFSGSTIYHNIPGEHVIDLTGPNRTDFSGQAWSKRKINLNDPFRLEFYAYLGNALQRQVVADGITLIFRNGTAEHVGGVGSSIGAYGNGLGRAHVLEFDTYYNSRVNQDQSLQDGDHDLFNYMTIYGNHTGHVAIRTSGSNDVVSRHTVLFNGTIFNPVADGGWRKVVYNWDPGGNFGNGRLYGSVGGSSFSLNYNLRNDLADPNSVYWGFTSGTGPLAGNPVGGQSQGVFFTRVYVGTDLSLSKVSTRGDFLEGAEFLLKAVDGGSEVTLVDSGDGTYRLPENFRMTLGKKYLLKETRAPAGHSLSEIASWEISIDLNGRVTVNGQSVPTEKDSVHLTVENRFSPVSVGIKKYAEGNKEELLSLSGAVFQLEKKSAGGAYDLVEEKMTDTEGFAPFTLQEPGDYRMKETQGPVGYDTVAGDYEFSLTKYGEIIYAGDNFEENAPFWTLRHQNQLKPFDLEIQKTDEMGEPLKGAKFQLTGPNINVTLPSDNQAIDHFMFKNLFPGKYTLTELEAPENFEKNSEPLLIDILNDGTVENDRKPVEATLMEGDTANKISMAITNKAKPLLPLVFYKVNEEYQPMENVAFTLYQCFDDTQNHTHEKFTGEEFPECWQYVEETASDEIGEVRFNNLKKGNYLLVETRTHSGYELPLGNWEVHFDPYKEVIDERIHIEAVGDKLPPAFMIEEQEGEKVLKLPNYPTTILPKTGSLGALVGLIAGITCLGMGGVYYIFTDSKNKD
ncbi:SpaA isopeptide-forming pilin-related protein [Vagococcus elongatus]|uniref:SpaA-like prealbumin fold domain-containing protein n=1 Tax=Vagococcus elongatus TaxID=180344 RepID=A0A430B5K4_9ENTE|nr:SpaA isopeptide-forming pilin-related protein [Vagococcus elongatus]RSU15532.1 hypothetical protein CBF29_00190 [Vagococcus elongatus]